MQKNERREALADFLRKRRATRLPGEVGLPPGLRRRTPGLRREEVAQLANIGTSWYVWLEQGREVHPSAQVLESLAQALRLTPNERRHLFLLAGQALPLLVSPAEESIGPALQQVLDDLNPSPVYVLGRRYDFWHGTKLPMPSSPFRTPLRIHRLPMRVIWSGDSLPARRCGNAPTGKCLRGRRSRSFARLVLAIPAIPGLRN